MLLVRSPHECEPPAVTAVNLPVGVGVAFGCGRVDHDVGFVLVAVQERDEL